MGGAASGLLSDNLDQHAFTAIAVELAVEDLLPGTEVQPALGNSDDDLPAHDGALEMGIGVVFTGTVVLVVGGGGMRGELLQPTFEIVVQPRFIVIDENGGGDVHGIDEAQPLLNATFTDEARDGIGNIDEPAATGNLEPELFRQTFHSVVVTELTAVGKGES